MAAAATGMATPNGSTNTAAEVWNFARPASPPKHCSTAKYAFHIWMLEGFDPPRARTWLDRLLRR
jgi:hypothetical protein